MNLDPTRGRRDRLPTVLHPPPLHEADTDRTHPSQLVDGFEPLVDGLGQLVGEVPVVKDAHVTPRGDLTDGRRMPPVAHIRVGTLHEYAALTQALRPHLPAHVEEPYPPHDVPARLLDDRVPVYVGEEPQAEAVGGAGVREAVDGEAGLGGVEDFPDAVLHLVVVDGAPVRRLAVGHGLVVDGRGL